VDIEGIALSVVDALQAESIPWLLAGSFSSNYFGIPRSTRDADFVVELQDRSILRLGRHLPDGFHIDPQIEFETVTGTRRNVITVDGHDFKVELFRLSNDDHDQERFRRRTEVRLFGRGIFLPTPEDVIVTKLRWMRSKDSDDVTNVIAVQAGTLDWPYIHHWANLHGTSAGLQRIRDSIVGTSEDNDGN